MLLAQPAVMKPMTATDVIAAMKSRMKKSADQIIPPGGFGVRFDSHAYAGYTVSPHYDSMIGKLLVHRATREEGLATMIRALEEFKVEGVKTSIPLLLKILKSDAFANEVPDVGFLERHFMN